MMSCPKALAAAPMGRRDDPCRADANEGGEDRGHKDVDFGLLADGLAALSSDDGHKQYGKWTARRRPVHCRHSRR